MRRIFKYKVPEGLPGTHVIEVSRNAVFLSLGYQPVYGLVLWYEVEADEATEPRTYKTVWTGKEPPENGTYLGSATNDYGLVYHVYDISSH